MVDAYLMAPFVRAVDTDEIKVSYGSEPLDALIHGIRRSDTCKTVRVNDEIMMMFGIGRHTLVSDQASIWMLATSLIEDHPTKFLRGCGEELTEISRGFKIVENWCDARNKVTLRWLRWLGFTIEEAEPYGIFGMPFHHFYKEVS